MSYDEGSMKDTWVGYVRRIEQGYAGLFPSEAPVTVPIAEDRIIVTSLVAWV